MFPIQKIFFEINFFLGTRFPGSCTFSCSVPESDCGVCFPCPCSIDCLWQKNHPSHLRRHVLSVCDLSSFLWSMICCYTGYICFVSCYVVFLDVFPHVCWYQSSYHIVYSHIVFMFIVQMVFQVIFVDKCRLTFATLEKKLEHLSFRVKRKLERKKKYAENARSSIL